MDRIELADPRLPEHLHADGELRHDGQLLGKLQRRDRDAFGGRFGADLVVGGATRESVPKWQVLRTATSWVLRCWASGLLTSG